MQEILFAFEKSTCLFSLSCTQLITDTNKKNLDLKTMLREI